MLFWGGKTKDKIARVSGAQIELPSRSLKLEIRGNDSQRRRAKKYVKCVMDQRVGPVTIDENDGDDDLVVVTVPQEAAGFVTGTNGNFLRFVEDEFGTIMFFADFHGRPSSRRAADEKLAIFGPLRGRRAAELKVKAVVESKVPGYFSKGLEEHISDGEDWGTDRFWLKQGDVSWALGRKGGTKRKVSRASGCLVEYVGHCVHMSGTKEERTNAQRYLQWIMDELKGPVEVDTKDRKDVTVMFIPQDCVGYVMGVKRETLGRIEDEWGAYMLFLDKKGDSNPDGRAKLAIFGLRRARRGCELKVMSTVETKAPGFFTKGTKEEKSSEEWGTDTYLFRGDELSYALGKEGSTKRKLARAANCIMEYVGDFCFFSGTKEERRRARRYLDLLLKQRSGQVHVDDVHKADDVTYMTVPKESIADVMGNRAKGLRDIEESTGSFLFLARSRDGEQLVICGFDPEARRKSEAQVRNIIMHGRPVERRSRSRSRSRSRGRNHGGRDLGRGRGGRGRSRGRRPRSFSRSPPRRGREHYGGRHDEPMSKYRRMDMDMDPYWRNPQYEEWARYYYAQYAARHHGQPRSYSKSSSSGSGSSSSSSSPSPPRRRRR
eukprot:NODE_228_length_2086_cov_144.817869_g196_i0.p1 GENE.NODE_228_length_2086_cov_144.817869_g196_i0~~NODE_228_length_2086_cov_144.817869_g196_i0.p1  ORF type:complete len:604 (-),score=185.06 NODE_228_length_2086_cov_144.817869_g196_i0:148-1959(-)